MNTETKLETKLETKPEEKLVKLKSGVTVNVLSKQYSGVLTQTIHKTDRGFAIVKVNGVSCLGLLPSPVMGAKYSFDGAFEEDKKYNTWQFKFKKFEVEIDHIHGMRDYLIREAPGLGPQLATKIVNEFRDRTLDVLENQPETLASRFPGISVDKAICLQDWAKGERSNFHIKERLYTIGLTPSQVTKTIAHYGNNAERKIKEDCFKLTEIHGFGFKTVSAIADMIGIPKDDPGRIKASLLHAITVMCDEGHTCVARSQVVRESCALLALNQNLVAPIFDKMIEDGMFVPETRLFRDYVEEHGIVYP